MASDFKLDFKKYDNPERAAKIYLSYLKDDISEEVEKDARSLISQFTKADNLDLALDQLTSGHETTHICGGRFGTINLNGVGFRENSVRAFEDSGLNACL